MSGAIDSLTKTVGDLGNVAGDALSGNFNKVGSDLGKTVQDGLPLAIDAGVAMFAPEALGAMGGLGGLGGAGGLGDISSMLGSLSGFGGASPAGSLTGFPSPFSLGNLFPGALQNAFSSALPGFGTGGGTATGAGTGTGGESWSQIQNDLQQAQASGDPMQVEQAMEKAQQYQEAVELKGEIAKMQHQLNDDLIKSIA